MINSAIRNIVDNNSQDINIQECFDEIFSGVCNSVLAGTFLSLIKNRETFFDDLLSGINSARNAIKKISLEGDYDFLTENICLNHNNNYLDISFAMDIILSANEAGIVKSSPYAYCSINRSYETLKAFGIDIDRLNYENFEKTRFLYDFINQESPYIKYTQELFRTLPFDSIINTINYFLNPFCVKNCSVALNDKNLVEKYANLCLNLGYKNSIVFSSGDFCFVSPEGETFVCEAWKNKIFSYTVAPELLGINQNPLTDLHVENIEHNKEILTAVFENKLKNTAYDTIVVNSALALYITKKSKSLMEGIELAKSTIDKGLALEKLQEIIKI